MSSGKKKRKPKRTYSEGEYVRAVRMATDDATMKLILMYLAAVTEMFDLDENKMLEVVNTLKRYQEYEEMGLVPLEKYSDVLQKHGVDLRLRRY